MKTGNYQPNGVISSAESESYHLWSFNILEFISSKVNTDGLDMLKIIDSPAKDVNFALSD